MTKLFLSLILSLFLASCGGGSGGAGDYGGSDGSGGAGDSGGSGGSGDSGDSGDSGFLKTYPNLSFLNMPTKGKVHQSNNIAFTNTNPNAVE